MRMSVKVRGFSMRAREDLHPGDRRNATNDNDEITVTEGGRAVEDTAVFVHFNSASPLTAETNQDWPIPLHRGSGVSGPKGPIHKSPARIAGLVRRPMAGGLKGTALPHSRASAVAAMCAVVQAAWKLKPPVMPSMSRHSPAK